MFITFPQSSMCVLSIVSTPLFFPTPSVVWHSFERFRFMPSWHWSNAFRISAPDSILDRTELNRVFNNTKIFVYWYAQMPPAELYLSCLCSHLSLSRKTADPQSNIFGKISRSQTSLWGAICKNIISDRFSTKTAISGRDSYLCMQRYYLWQR